MRFSHAEAMTDPTYYIPDSVSVSPCESQSAYPSTPDRNREFLDGKAVIETFVLTAALGAVTSALLFTFVVLTRGKHMDECVEIIRGTDGRGLLLIPRRDL